MWCLISRLLFKVADCQDRNSLSSVNSEIYDQNPENKEIFIEENFEVNLEDDLETAIRKKWEIIIGSSADIVVCNLTKLKGKNVKVKKSIEVIATFFSGLGISLEGTVDVEGGIELRPHHYIRSILPEGPVGQSGKLSPGDELLEVWKSLFHQIYNKWRVNDLEWGV